MVEFLNESIQLPIDKQTFDISALLVTKKSLGAQLVTKKLVISSKEIKMKTKTEMETDQRRAKALVEFLNESISDIEMKKENQRLTRSAKQRLPSFISHPNGMVLRVLKTSYIPAILETKKIAGPRFIYHPNGILLKVLNQKRSVPCALRRSTSSSPPSVAAQAAASMIKMRRRRKQIRMVLSNMSSN